MELRARAQALSPTLYVGKDGVTEKVTVELSKQLERNKLVKARFLPSASGDSMALGKELAEKSGSVLVEVRGRTAVLARE